MKKALFLLITTTTIVLNVIGQELASFNFQNSNFQTQDQQFAGFEENKGQMKDQNNLQRPDVLYFGTSENMNFFIRNTGMSYQLNQVESWKNRNDLEQSQFFCNQSEQQVADQMGIYRVDVEWKNYNSNYSIEIGKEIPGYTNYYNVPEGIEPALNVKKFENITLKNIWNGIDIHYYGTNGYLETDYIVAPWSDYKQIQFEIKGADVRTDSEGNLLINTPFGEIREGQLKVFQNSEILEAHWILSPSASGKKDQWLISLEIPHFKPEIALRIDPLVRVWATYYGGTNNENSASSTVDFSGNVYLAGSTASTTLIASGGHQNTIGGNYDLFLVKFDPSGNRLWATYYGGNNGEDYTQCACDNVGNVYLTGLTLSANGIASNGFQNTPGGDSDLFLVKFNSNGFRQWATYYGGLAQETSPFCTTDGAGNVLLTGLTLSSNGIASGGHQNTFGGDFDVFLAKFNSNGSRLWSTYYGGLYSEFSAACSADPSGNIYLVGATSSPNGIASGGYQNFLDGSGDCFLVKFNSNGVRVWGTYYGGNLTEGLPSCATDANGNVFVSGSTNSIINIALNGHQNVFGGGMHDAFVFKFNSSGLKLWGTYYGGSNDEFPDNMNPIVKALATDAMGNVYLTGKTYSTDNIAFNGYQNMLIPDINAYLVKFNTNGVRQWGTYFGGGWELDPSCAVDGNGNVFLSGWTKSGTGISYGGFQNLINGNTGGSGPSDLYLVKFNQSNMVELAEHENIIDQGFKVSPNPVSDIARVEIVDQNILNESIIWELYDAYGQLVKSDKIINSIVFNIDCGMLSSGIYLLKLKDKTTLIGLSKLVVE